MLRSFAIVLCCSAALRFVPFSSSAADAVTAAGDPATASDTVRAFQRYRIIVTSRSMPREESPEWLTSPDLRSRGLSLVIRSIVNAPIGATWTQWGTARSRPAECDAFCGSPSLLPYEDYWVYRCTKKVAGGALEFFTYFVGEGQEPTLERARWLPGQALDLDRESRESLHAALVDSLTRAYGSPSKGVLGADSDTSAENFRGPGAVVSALSSVGSGFAIELRSDTFRRDEAKDWWMFGDPRDVPEDVPALRRDVAEVLRPRWADLARALETSPPSLDDVGTVGVALGGVRGRTGEEHDLVAFAAHLWVSLLTEGRDDSLLRRGLEPLAPLGLEVRRTHYQEACYTGSLLDSLALRAGENRWTDEAFLYFQQRGWEKECDCGWSDFPGADQFRAVIERGETFLAEHPNSTVRNAVAFTVAQAHETAWSLARSRCGDTSDGTGWAWQDYVIDAPRHRTRAIEIYERLLREAPQIPGLVPAARRLSRLAIDVDTDYHRYWCSSD